MPGPPIYRPFRPEDAEDCRRVVLACLDGLTGMGERARAALRARVAATRYDEDLARACCLVAFEDGTVIGLGALEGCEVRRMYVHPAHQGRGIGRALHRLLETEARARGVRELHVESSLNAEEAMRNPLTILSGAQPGRGETGTTRT